MSPDASTTLDPQRQGFLRDLAGAAHLEISQIDPDEDFLGLGVDSVRLMGLLERWRSRGVDVAFADLAACLTVREALDTLAAASPTN